MSEKLKLTCVCAALRALGYRDLPNYRRLITLAQSASFPAEQIAGKWHVERADLLEIAAALGLRRD